MLLLATLLVALGLPAAEAPACWKIRLYVSVYGEKKAASWARNHGYSQLEIEAARRRCLAS